jgi:hypothetical protein
METSVKWLQMHSQAQRLQEMADQLDQSNQGFSRAELEDMADQVKQMHRNVEAIRRAKGVQPSIPDVAPMPTQNKLSMKSKSRRHGRGQGIPLALASPPLTMEPGPRKPEKPEKGFGSLRNFLDTLRHEDMRCIFIARGIKHLGFKSKSVLERHFAQYGELTHVFVPASKTKATVRPGNLGVLVMRDPEAVERILAEGPEQWIKGVQIQVAMYERPSLPLDQLDDPDAVCESLSAEHHPSVQATSTPMPSKHANAQLCQYSALGAFPSYSSQTLREEVQPLRGDANCENVQMKADRLPCSPQGIVPPSGPMRPEVMAEMALQLSHLQVALHGIDNYAKNPERLPQEELLLTMAALETTQQQLGQLGQRCHRMALGGGSSRVQQNASPFPDYPAEHAAEIQSQDVILAVPPPPQGMAMTSGLGAAMILQQYTPPGVFQPGQPFTPLSAVTAPEASPPAPLHSCESQHEEADVSDEDYNAAEMNTAVNGMGMSWDRFVSPQDAYWR